MPASDCSLCLTLSDAATEHEIKKPMSSILQTNKISCLTCAEIGLHRDPG